MRNFRAIVLSSFAALAVLAALVAGLMSGGLIARAQEEADTGLAIGEAVVVIDGRLNLRSDATLDADVITIMADGTYGTVTDGPVSADGYDWYALDVDGTTGWAAGEFLAPAASDGVLPVDSVVFVNTDALNLREASGLDAAVITTMPTDTEATVLVGPETVDGYDWYQLDVDGTVGWAVRDFLAFPESTTADTTDAAATAETTDTADTTTETTDTAATEEATDATATDDTTDATTSAVFAVGDAVVTDGTPNLRADASLSGEVIDVLPDGSAATILDGPVEADGYTWYQVSTDLGDGWVAGEFLVAA
jgi:uncharacterized protein YgiM (DUF1202 family)